MFSFASVLISPQLRLGHSQKHQRQNRRRHRVQSPPISPTISITYAANPLTHTPYLNQDCGARLRCSSFSLARERCTPVVLNFRRPLTACGVPLGLDSRRKTWDLEIPNRRRNTDSSDCRPSDIREQGTNRPDIVRHPAGSHRRSYYSIHRVADTHGDKSGLARPPATQSYLLQPIPFGITASRNPAFWHIIRRPIWQS